MTLLILVTTFNPSFFLSWNLTIIPNPSNPFSPKITHSSNKNNRPFPQEIDFKGFQGKYDFFYMPMDPWMSRFIEAGFEFFPRFFFGGGVFGAL